MRKIVFAEGGNEVVREAAEKVRGVCEPVLLKNGDLSGAAAMVARGEADGLVAGIDHASRDVILAVRDGIGVREDTKTFSGMFVCDMPDGRRYIVADGAACKNPTAEQLADIVVLVHEASLRLLQDEPRVAMLSFSTLGSGGKDASLDKIREAMELVRERVPEILMDGEMQLDAAIAARVADKKGLGESAVAGRANVLIAPDITSGNILAKAMELLGGAAVAGPILLGFRGVASDVSRGSTADEVAMTAECLVQLLG